MVRWMSLSVEQCNRRMLRARDAMDRTLAALCIPHLAQVAEVSEAHFIRTFRDTFGETPHDRSRTEGNACDSNGPACSSHCNVRCIGHDRLRLVLT